MLACPTFAIGVEKVDVAAWRADHSAADAPGLPPADITLSTTRITVPAGAPAEMTAADDHRVEPEKPHWPLIALTLLTQVSLGIVATVVLLETAGASRGRGGLAGAAFAAFLAGAVALAASLLHLGRPTRALKALRNLRTSWLSREVALFSAFSVLSFAYAASWLAVADDALPGLGLVAVALGTAGVYASARLYLVPARPVWNSRRTPVSFFATAVAAGPLLTLLCVDRSRLRPGWVGVLLAVAATGSLVQVGLHAQLARAVRRRADRQHQGTAFLLLERVRILFAARRAAVGGGLLLLASVVTVPVAGPAAGGRLATAVVVIALGELAGRYLFYVTVVPFRVAGSFFRAR